MAKIIPINGLSTSMVATALGGVSTRDVGGLCTHPNINMWAMYKPIRYNSVEPLPKSVIETAMYGIIVSGVNDPYSPAFSYSSPYFGYNKPRGGDYNEYFRLGDFLNPDSKPTNGNKNLTGYNHDAECFIMNDEIEDRLSFEKVFEVQTSLTEGGVAGKFDTTKILNNSTNVDIPHTSFTSYITQNSYVGIFFHNTTTGAKFYTVYNVKWRDVGTTSKSWVDFFPTNVVSSYNGGVLTWQENFYRTGDQIAINNNDTVNAYYCSVPLDFANTLEAPQSWRVGYQNPNYWMDLFNSEDVINFITVRTNGIQIVAPAFRHGQGAIRITKADFMDNNQLSLYNKRKPYDLIGYELTIALYRTANDKVGCTSSRVPLSSYYFSNFSETISSSIEIEFLVESEGVILLKQTVRKGYTNKYAEVSGTRPADGSANFYVASTGGAIRNEANITSPDRWATVTAKITAISTGPTPLRRVLVDGKCSMSTGGAQNWIWYG